MKDRIRLIMEAQHMTQQVFADFIGTTSATLSGIFNDRTRPTLNIVELIKKKIPDINTDWLVFGSGEMYLSSSPAARGGEPSPGMGRQAGAGHQPNDTMIDFGTGNTPTPGRGLQQQLFPNGVQQTRINPLREEIKIIDKPKRHVTEIRVYYDDQTWESFVPSKK